MKAKSTNTRDFLVPDLSKIKPKYPDPLETLRCPICSSRLSRYSSYEKKKYKKEAKVMLATSCPHHGIFYFSSTDRLRWSLEPAVPFGKTVCPECKAEITRPEGPGLYFCLLCGKIYSVSRFEHQKEEA